MQISQIASEKSELWFQLKKGALISTGHAFSFELNIPTEEIKYEYSDLDAFPRWKKKHKESHSIQHFEQSVSKLFPDVTYEKKYLCFKDSREKGKKSGFLLAEVIKGYKIVVHVNEKFSHKLYTELYAESALPFRDKLLCRYKELLEKIGACGNLKIIETTRLSSVKEYFYINVEGIWRYEPYSYSNNIYEDNFGNRFANFGMANLSDIHECYGMALALIEINMPEWTKFGKVNVEIFEARKANNCIGVTYWVTRDEPVLRAW